MRAGSELWAPGLGQPALSACHPDALVGACPHPSVAEVLLLLSCGHHLSREMAWIDRAAHLPKCPTVRDHGAALCLKKGPTL